MLKIMTGLMKMGGPFIHTHWRQLCYWELQYGYVPYKKIEDMQQEVEEWLCHRNSLGGPIREDAYMDELYMATHEFMAENWKKPKTIMPVKDWMRNGKWMEGRSGDGNTIVIDIDGKPVRSRRMIKAIWDYILPQVTEQPDIELAWGHCGTHFSLKVQM